VERGTPTWQPQLAHELKGAWFVGLENPENLTNRQASKLATIQQTNVKLYRAYLLRSSFDRSAASRPRPPSGCLTGGWHGRVAAGFHRS
jgi:Transposase